jgi:FkbM family methyltransferase
LSRVRPGLSRRASVVAAVKNFARRALPTRLRHKLWLSLLKKYFDRRAIKMAIKHIATQNPELPDKVQLLIAILERNGYRSDHPSIKDELGLDFKAYSCQDIIAFLYFQGIPDGFFIDIGAHDGIQISNTYVLEQQGWQGICIEPIPEIYSLLQENRSCDTFNVAISSSTDKAASFFKVSGMEGLSGLERQMPDRIRLGLQERGLDIELITVNAIPFDELMKTYPHLEYVDFLSIDVEGGEQDVLDSIDFQRMRFGLITIENNPGTEILAEFMNRQNYQIFVDLGTELMFIPNKRPQ